AGAVGQIQKGGGVPTWTRGFKPGRTRRNRAGRPPPSYRFQRGSRSKSPWIAAVRVLRLSLNDSPQNQKRWLSSLSSQPSPSGTETLLRAAHGCNFYKERLKRRMIHRSRSRRTSWG